MIYYHSVNTYLKETFGRKVYKVALDAGFTCPNRDGTKGFGGCTFCAGGSGDFAERIALPEDADPASITQENAEKAVFQAIDRGIRRISGKNRDGAYIAYFQSYTNTYGPAEKLEKLFRAAVRHPEITGVSIATRPDCLPDETVRLLGELNREKPVWVELGLQTMHERTAERIRRGYPLPVYEDAVRRLKAAGVQVIVHMILGLPGESAEDMVETARYIGRSGADGIKLQLLHVLKGTALQEEYEKGLFEAMSLETYVDTLKQCVEVLPPDIVVHRLTGDGAKKDLIAPLWSADKKRVLNEIRKVLRPREEDPAREG